MKTLLAMAACAAALLGASCAYAEPQADSVQIKAPVKVAVEPGEFDDYAYSYDLSNGERIAFSRRGQHYFARLDGQAKTALHPRGEGVFVTDTGARVEFADQGATLVIRNYERLAIGAGLPENTVMMAQR
ncbi:hypothetical protein LJR289_004183 [Pseudoduganella sp. LjRoot289]|uniref:hypothetical protein n=1 Tax=Pseudoduganella sp. LjRoot289 TaxID=3342314 RepID=UPI003ECFAB2D